MTASEPDPRHRELAFEHDIAAVRPFAFTKEDLVRAKAARLGRRGEHVERVGLQNAEESARASIAIVSSRAKPSASPQGTSL